MDILDYIDTDLLQNANKVYFKPYIPTQKMKNAINSFGFEIEPDDIEILIDNTLFGSAKEGVVITNDTLFCKEILKDPFVMPLSNIESITVRKNTLSSSLIINDKKSIIDLSQPEYDDLDLLFGGINVYLEEINEFDVLDEDEQEDESLEYDEVDQEIHNLFMSCFKDDFSRNLSGDEEALKRDKELLIKEINYLESAKISIQKDIEKLNKIKSLSKGRTSKIATYISGEIPILLAEGEKYLQIINETIDEKKEWLEELIEDEESSSQESEEEIIYEESTVDQIYDIVQEDAQNKSSLDKEKEFENYEKLGKFAISPLLGLGGGLGLKVGTLWQGAKNAATATSCFVGWHSGEYAPEEGKPRCHLAKTCPNCNKYITKVSHRYGDWIYQSDNRCDVYKKCEYCDDKVLEKDHHQFGDWEYTSYGSCNMKQECKRCKKDKFKVSHNYERVAKNSNCRIIHQCSRCRDEYLGSAEHEWITAFNRELSVNTSEGRKRKCRQCGTMG